MQYSPYSLPLPGMLSFRAPIPLERNLLLYVVRGLVGAARKRAGGGRVVERSKS